MMGLGLIGLGGSSIATWSALSSGRKIVFVVGAVTFVLCNFWAFWELWRELRNLRRDVDKLVSGLGLRIWHHKVCINGVGGPQALTQENDEAVDIVKRHGGEIIEDDPVSPERP